MQIESKSNPKSLKYNEAIVLNRRNYKQASKNIKSYIVKSLHSENIYYLYRDHCPNCITITVYTKSIASDLPLRPIERKYFEQEIKKRKIKIAV